MSGNLDMTKPRFSIWWRTLWKEDVSCWAVVGYGVVRLMSGCLFAGQR